MNADVLTTRLADGIAVITLGSARRIYFDEEMGDALTEALDGFAGDASVRIVVVTGGAPGYFIRHFSIAALDRRQEMALPLPNSAHGDKAIPAKCRGTALVLSGFHILRGRQDSNLRIRNFVCR
jgi:enoyl-CoA hydratase/carnithine racemase